jgi:hypothetical protein
VVADGDGRPAPAGPPRTTKWEIVDTPSKEPAKKSDMGRRVTKVLRRTAFTVLWIFAIVFLLGLLFQLFIRIAA